MKDIIAIAFTLLFWVFMLDFVSWVMWALSGQNPVDNYYLGTVTQHILQWIFL